MRTALVCIAKWEDTIEEWCNYHLKLGFDKIFIYQNDWVYFGSGDQLTIEGDKKSFISRFFKRGDINTHIKSILNMKCNSIMTLPHNPKTPLLGTNKEYFTGPFNPNGNIEIAQLNHYYHKSLEEWSKLYERGQSDHTSPKKPERWYGLSPHSHIEDKLAYNFYYNQ